MSFAFQYNGVLLGPSLVNGIAQAGLYGLLAVGLVLTYRVSRTVAFVNGGIAMLGAMGLWWLTFNSVTWTGPRPTLPPLVGLLILLVVGAILGGLYGKLVTGRKLADWPKLTMTTFSLGIMLILLAIIPLVWDAEVGGNESPRSPFGSSRFRIFDTYVTVHQAATIGVTVALVIALALVTKRTRGGIFLRAIADDVESSRWVGVPINTVGTAVYAGVGALSMMAGALIAPVQGPNFIDVLFIFLRALTAAVLGGFNSFTLALAGALVFGVVDSCLRTGLFGDSTPGQREMLTVGAVFLAVIIVSRYRKNVIEVLEAEGL
jgi:branched-chain amino acid transport system permease protein